MAASYPGAVKNFTAVVNGVTKLVAALFNACYDEVTAIQTELGTDPAGSAADLKTRLAIALNNDGTIKASAVSSTMLNTTTGEVSRSTAGYLTLAGGTYAFFPQTKTTSGTSCVTTLNGSHTGATDPGATYGNFIYVYDFAGGGSYYAQTRYVTSSGTDWFVFLLVDKVTKEIVALYSSADHPSYGRGGDYNKIPHPFEKDDLTKYDVVLLDMDTVKSLQEESIDIDEETGKKRLATLINETYRIDTTKMLPYVPLHSGKFKNKTDNGKEIVVKHMVENIPNYIKVRGLVKK